MQVTNSTDTEDLVAKRTNEFLEAMADVEEEKEEENVEEEVQDQIFSPYSFWTERSGRFPRKINEQ